MIKVYCVDDSKPVLDVLSRLLSSDPEIDVVGQATNGEDALVGIMSTLPDVVTLDIKMPGMSGLEVLKRIRSRAPIPVIIVSSYTQPGVRITFEALELGAFDFIAKPASGKLSDLEKMKSELVKLVKVADEFGRSKARHPGGVSKDEKPDSSGFGTEKPGSHKSFIAEERRRLGVLTKEAISAIEAVGIGSSTGGPFALTEFLPILPGSFPWPILVVQHMPPYFTSYFAKKLDAKCDVKVKEAENGEEALAGHVYIAPGDAHIRIEKADGVLFIKLDSTSDGHYACMPSVTALFESMSRTLQDKSIGILLSGMGNDGADGLLMMKEAGAITAVQDRTTSVVYGMPGSALKLGAAVETLRPSEIPLFIYNSVRRRAIIALHVSER